MDIILQSSLSEFDPSLEESEISRNDYKETLIMIENEDKSIKEG